VLLKAEAELRWPEDERFFYLVARNGLFLCRNHDFFRSCVPARGGPGDLSEQRTFLQLAFPAIPRRLFERIVGFFHRIAELHGAEASVLLAWDSAAACVRLVVPSQTAVVGRSEGGGRQPIGLRYTPPAFPSGWIPFGDVHSHAWYEAYSSQTDVEDETYSAGLHVVVGRIDREPPEVHVEAVVDGTRFRVDPKHVIEGYERRDRGVPEAWIERVRVEYQPYGSTPRAPDGRIP
jgi:hypothetical protein